jgi:transposase InsO family protein
VIDASARRIVAWRASRTAHATVLDALEQSLHAWRPLPGAGLVHHGDRGGDRYPERLADAGVVASVGSVGYPYDNAPAETINRLYKAEMIHRRGPRRSLEAVEYVNIEWVDWFNNRTVSRADRQHPAGRGRTTLVLAGINETQCTRRRESIGSCRQFVPWLIATPLASKTVA